MAVLEVDDILSYLAPGMILSVLYVIFFVAYRMGKRTCSLGVLHGRNGLFKNLRSMVF